MPIKNTREQWGSVSKILHWVVVLLIPLLVMMFLSIRRHYADVAGQLSLDQHDLVVVVEQLEGDRAPDGTRSGDRDAHGLSLPAGERRPRR